MLLEILAAGLILGSLGKSNSGNNLHSSPKRKDLWEFEEADSFTDKHGNEHIVDYEGYCEECDDYHDDY